MLSNRRTLVVLLVCAALTLSVFSSASAAGFAAARFGGERGNPTEGNPTAIYYNPAGLALGEGFQLTLDTNFVYRSASYRRPVSSVSPNQGGDADRQAAAVAVNSGEATLSNFLFSPMIGLSYNFKRDLNIPLGIGLGLYFPFGGQAVWDEQEGDERFPGSADGPQRWFTIDGVIRTMAISAGLAYTIEPLRLSLGLSFNYYKSEIDTVRARISAGEDRIEAGNPPTLLEGRAWLTGESTDIGLGAGLIWEAIEDRMWIGFSYQSRPGFDGKLTLEGELAQTLGNGEPGIDPAYTTQQMPDIFRLGFRFRPSADFELRLFGDYTRWGNFESQCVVNSELLGDRDVYDYCRFNADGSSVTGDTPAIITNIPRDWHDAFGIRAGVSYWFNPRFELLAGLGYDGSAIPSSTLEPALIDAPKISASLGVRIEVVRQLALMVTATNIYFVERDTTGNPTGTARALPTKQPNSAGVYNQNFLLLGTNLELRF